MKKDLAKLEKEFANNIWQRGREYYREGLVGNIIKSGDAIKAESYGNSTYRLKINLKTKHMDCSCPCDFHCKHLAALIIWLKNNRMADFSRRVDALKSKTKEELVAILSNILKKQPELSIYLQTLDDKAIVDLIKKAWFPRHGDGISLFNKLDFIKESILKKRKFNLIILFLKKLIDMYDHDPDGLMGYIDNFLDELSKKKLTKKQKTEIRVMLKDYPFDDW